MPPGFLAVLVFRGETSVTPNGDTRVYSGDVIVCAAPAFEDRENLTLHEISIGKNHRWRDRMIKDLPLDAGLLIIMVKRGENILIPNGETKICRDDVLVLRRQAG